MQLGTLTMPESKLRRQIDGKGAIDMDSQTSKGQRMKKVILTTNGFTVLSVKCK